jgi:hypothetical protein
MKRMFDHETLWAACQADRDERLRRAAADRIAAQVPSERSVLRAHVSRWLHGLATRIDPTVAPVAVDRLRSDMLGA